MNWCFTGTNDEGEEVSCVAHVINLDGIQADLIAHTVIKTLKYKGWFDFFGDLTILII